MCEDIVSLAGLCHEAWLPPGDFNNVRGMEDRVKEILVVVREFQDIQDMVSKSGLFSCQILGDNFTWSNRYQEGLIFSSNDHDIGVLN